MTFLDLPFFLDLPQVYRHSPTHDEALVYMSLEAHDSDIIDGTNFSEAVIQNLKPLGVYAVDITGDEMGKTHAKHLAGGRPGAIKGERTIRFEFPESGRAVAPARSHAVEYLSTHPPAPP